MSKPDEPHVPPTGESTPAQPSEVEPPTIPLAKDPPSDEAPTEKRGAGARAEGPAKTERMPGRPQAQEPPAGDGTRRAQKTMPSRAPEEETDEPEAKVEVRTAKPTAAGASKVAAEVGVTPGKSGGPTKTQLTGTNPPRTAPGATQIEGARARAGAEKSSSSGKVVVMAIALGLGVGVTLIWAMQSASPPPPPSTSSAAKSAGSQLPAGADSLPPAAPNGPLGPGQKLPTALPAELLSALATAFPSGIPTTFPTTLPSNWPAGLPTLLPSNWPAGLPTGFPTALPTVVPIPTAVPTLKPTVAPTAPTPKPTVSVRPTR